MGGSDRDCTGTCSGRRVVRSGATLVGSALLLAWAAPFLTVVTPGAVLSRDTLLGLAACVTRIPDALDLVDEERGISAVEREAFAQFAQRLEAIEATAEPTRPAPPAGSLATPDAETRNICAVREAYRETVMAMPHYEEEYGESLQANMAAEFGPEIAVAVAEHDALTPQLKRALAGAADRAREERDSFLCELDREGDRLAEAEAELTEIDDVIGRLDREFDTADPRSAGEILSAYRRLEDLEADCERTLQARQEQLHRDDQRGELSLQEYLYAGREWTFPVLDDALDCIERIGGIKNRLTTLMGRLP